VRWLGAITGDLRQAVRVVRASPAFTATAVLTLALGIGANTAVFSVVNALMFRPLPVADADRLVVLAASRAPSRTLGPLSYPEIDDYRAGATGVLEGAAGYSAGFAGMAFDDQAPARVLVTWVTGGYFPLLRLSPTIGRLIDEGDVVRGRVSAVVVIGYDAWRTRLGANPAVVGEKLLVNGQPCTIVGVAPRGFTGAFAFADPELYLPVNWSSADVFGDRNARHLHTIGRLRTAVSLRRATAEFDVVSSRLQREYPDSNTGVRVTAIPERLARPEEDNARSNAFGSGVILLLVALVLLAADVNVLNLLLARAAARRRELAIRVAMGASRARLVQQLAVEAAFVAALGSAAGVAIASWTAAALRTVRLPGNLPAHLDFAIDGRVLAFAMALTCLTAATVGIVSALRGSRVEVDANLRDRRGSSRRHRVTGFLVVAQIAACFVLLVVAAMFIRSLREARHMDLGFDPRGVLNLQMDVAQLGYTDARGRELFDEIERRARRMPAVEDLSYAMTVPLGYVRLTARVAPAGTSARADRIGAGWNVVGARYFDVMRIPILRGRAFDDRDTARVERVAVVNQQLAGALWPGQDPIGRRFVESDGTALQVVGVAAASKYRLLFEQPEPYYYVPLTQRYTGLRVLHLRTSSPRPESLAPDVERVIRDLDPALPLYDVQSMEAALDGGYGFFLIRTAAVFSTLLGVLAAALAIVGLYGVVSCVVTERTREIGIRLALGATTGRIARMVLGDGAMLAGLGALAGAAAAFSAARIMSRLLFGVTPGDPLSYAAAAVCLIVVTLVAACGPAARAMATDPIKSLRE
jgi:putative ABC transport system permease protein